MFERYAEKSRRAIFFARYEASEFGSREIDTPHFMLGLLREGWDVFEPFLRSRGVIDSVRDQLKVVHPPKDRIATSVDIPLSHDCKRALAYAAEEAERLRHRTIEPVHLVLGLLRVESGEAAKILRNYGMTAEALRQRVAEPHVRNPDQDRERAIAALRDLPPDRLHFARRILEVLEQHTIIRVTIKTPDGSFTIPFKQAPAA